MDITVDITAVIMVITIIIVGPDPSSLAAWDPSS